MISFNIFFKNLFCFDIGDKKSWKMPNIPFYIIIHEEKFACSEYIQLNIDRGYIILTGYPAKPDIRPGVRLDFWSGFLSN